MQSAERLPRVARGLRQPQGDWLALGVRSLGAVAAAAGARGVLLGAREVTGSTPVPAAADSEYRFYAAWYMVSGLAVARTRAAVPREIHHVCAGLWLGAAGRVLSLRQVGRPTQGQLVLLGVELGLPVALLSWQAQVGRRRVA